MEFNKYQEIALSTAIYPQGTAGLMYLGLGLTGEAGEVADKLKKIYRDNDGEVSDEQAFGIAKELGDVLWYIANMADKLGYPLLDVAQMNTEKLLSRKSRNKIGGSGDER